MSFFVDTNEGDPCYARNTAGDFASNCGSTSTDYIPCLERYDVV